MDGCGFRLVWRAVVGGLRLACELVGWLVGRIIMRVRPPLVYLSHVRGPRIGCGHRKHNK